MPGALLDREDESARLEAAWAGAVRGVRQLGVVWGRRRVGKTFLLSRFAASRRAVFFAATQQAEPVELRRLYEAVGRDLGEAATDSAGGGFTSWEAALRFLASQARDEALLVVMDEVPYLARSTPGFASIVQSVWDHVAIGSHLMLVLTGSAIGTIDNMLGAGGALRGRPTVSLRLDPVDLLAARAFLPNLEPEQLLEAYAACGGYPIHLNAWDPGATTATNLLHLAGTAGGLLMDDAAGILAEELGEADGYRRVLAAIGRGRTRLSDIQTEAGQRIEHPLEVLRRAGFVRRSLPVGAPRKARPIYELGDVYLAFWFSVLYSDLAHVEGGQGRAVLARRQPQWERHLAWVFEEEARRHAVRLVASGVLPEGLVVGRWWTSSGEPCEVDVLGLQGTRTRLVGEARWQSVPLGLKDLRGLMAKASRVPAPVEDPLFALWGRRGVDPDVRRAGAWGFGVADLVTA